MIKLPILGLENQEIKNTFHLVLDYNKILGCTPMAQKAQKKRRLSQK